MVARAVLEIDHRGIDAVAADVLQRHGPGRRRSGPVTDLQPVPHHIVVGQRLAAIFAAADGDRHRFRYRTDPDLATRGVRALLGGRDGHIDLLARDRQRHRHRHHRALARLVDGHVDLAAVAADHLPCAVDDDLRRIDVAVAAHVRIGFLPRAEAGIRQRVLPAEIVPVVDRHAERDHAAIAGEIADDLVGWRARRTALRGEQFDDSNGLAVCDTAHSKSEADAGCARPSCNAMRGFHWFATLE